MANPPPPPAKKKSGLGCLGCGCLILVILTLLALGLIGGGTYLLYRGAYGLTSPTASEIPTFDGGDAVYNGAQQKITTFDQAVDRDQPASLRLSADELNTLLARNPGFNGLKIRLFLALTDDQGQVQMSVPLDHFTSLFKGRFLNADTSLSFNLDTDNRAIHLTLHNLKVGDHAVPDSNLPLIQQEIEPVVNAELQKSPYLKKILDRAKTIEIKDGQLDVETE